MWQIVVQLPENYVSLQTSDWSIATSISWVDSYTHTAFPGCIKVKSRQRSSFWELVWLQAIILQVPHTGAEILKCLKPVTVLCSVLHVMRFSSEFQKKTSHQYRPFQCQVLITCWYLKEISPIRSNNKTDARINGIKSLSPMNKTWHDINFVA